MLLAHGHKIVHKGNNDENFFYEVDWDIVGTSSVWQTLRNASYRSIGLMINKKCQPESQIFLNET